MAAADSSLRGVMSHVTLPDPRQGLPEQEADRPHTAAGFTPVPLGRGSFVVVRPLASVALTPLRSPCLVVTYSGEDFRLQAPILRLRRQFFLTVRLTVSLLLTRLIARAISALRAQ